MSLLLYLILLFVTGLFVGALGRLALPGPDPMTIPQTAAIGIAGNLIAGLILWAIFGSHGGAPFVISIASATAIVYLIRRARGGTLTRPAPPSGTLRR